MTMDEASTALTIAIEKLTEAIYALTEATLQQPDQQKAAAPGQPFHKGADIWIHAEQIFVGLESKGVAWAGGLRTNVGSNVNFFSGNTDTEEDLKLAWGCMLALKYALRGTMISWAAHHQGIRINATNEYILHLIKKAVLERDPNWLRPLKDISLAEELADMLDTKKVILQYVDPANKNDPVLDRLLTDTDRIRAKICSQHRDLE